MVGKTLRSCFAPDDWARDSLPGGGARTIFDPFSTVFDAASGKVTRAASYWNFSDRADWIVNDQWRLYGRCSRLHTMVDATDPTPNKSEALVTPGASARHATSSRKAGP